MTWRSSMDGLMGSARIEARAGRAGLPDWILIGYSREISPWAILNHLTGKFGDMR